MDCIIMVVDHGYNDCEGWSLDAYDMIPLVESVMNFMFDYTV